MKKRFLFALVLLLLLSTYNVQKKINLNSRLNIETIYVENNKFTDETILKKNFHFCTKQIFFYLTKKTLKLN